LTIFFWPGEPEAGFGVAMKKGNENHKLLSAAHQAKKTSLRGIPEERDPFWSLSLTCLLSGNSYLLT
jgi:hypothetical protein